MALKRAGTEREETPKVESSAGPGGSRGRLKPNIWRRRRFLSTEPNVFELEKTWEGRLYSTLLQGETWVPH